MAWSDRDIQNLNSADVNLSTSKTIVWASRVFTWINVRLLPALKSMAVAVSAASGKTDELDATQQNKMNRDYSNAPAHTRQSVQKLLGIGTTTNDVGKAPILNTSLNGFQWAVVGDGRTTLSLTLFYTPSFNTTIIQRDDTSDPPNILSPYNFADGVYEQFAARNNSFNGALNAMANMPTSAVIVKAVKSGTYTSSYPYTIVRPSGTSPGRQTITAQTWRIGYRTILPPGTNP